MLMNSDSSQLGSLIQIVRVYNIIISIYIERNEFEKDESKFEELVQTPFVKYERDIHPTPAPNH